MHSFIGFDAWICRESDRPFLRRLAFAGAGLPIADTALQFRK